MLIEITNLMKVLMNIVNIAMVQNYCIGSIVTDYCDNHHGNFDDCRDIHHGNFS